MMAQLACMHPYLHPLLAHTVALASRIEEPPEAAPASKGPMDSMGDTNPAMIGAGVLAAAAAAYFFTQ